MQECLRRLSKKVKIEIYAVFNFLFGEKMKWIVHNLITNSWKLFRRVLQVSVPFFSLKI